MREKGTHGEREQMPRRYDALMTRIAQGEQILIDGATGTEAERRGVPQLDNAWNGGGALSHPDIVRAIHEDYIRSGAEIIISNTFATHRSALHDAGVADQFDAYNRRGVELACEARANLGADNVLVAGGMSHWSWTGRQPSLDELRANAVDQAAIMASAGADLLMLEMMIDIARMLAVLDGAQQSGLPVWIGVTCTVDEHATVVLEDGEPLTEAMDAIRDCNIPLVSIMHTEVADVDACLEALRANWSGAIGVYAHSGDYVDGKWIFEGVISPDEYAAHAARWLQNGVQIIGGCCGVGPDHIHRLSDQV